jgi:hypothetical protein
MVSTQWLAVRIQLTENTVGRNRSHSPLSICPIRLNGKLPLLARAHVQQALIPSLDDLALTNSKAEGLTAVIRSIEL